MDVSMCVCVHEYIYVWIQQNNFPKCVLRRSPHRTLVECPNEARILALDHPQQNSFFAATSCDKKQNSSCFFPFFSRFVGESPMIQLCSPLLEDCIRPSLEKMLPVFLTFCQASVCGEGAQRLNRSDLMLLETAGQ